MGIFVIYSNPFLYKAHSQPEYCSYFSFCYAILNMSWSIKNILEPTYCSIKIIWAIIDSSMYILDVRWLLSSLFITYFRVESGPISKKQLTVSNCDQYVIVKGKHYEEGTDKGDEMKLLYNINIFLLH